MIESINPGDVVFAWASYGGQTKERPAVVIEVRDERAYVLLGSSQGVGIVEPYGFVTTAHEQREMRLPKLTRFHFGASGDQWISIKAITGARGKITPSVQQKIGTAWAKAKMQRVI